MYLQVRKRLNKLGYIHGGRVNGELVLAPGGGGVMVDCGIGARDGTVCLLSQTGK